MTDLVQAIPVANLTLIIIPVMAVVGIFYKWHLKFTNPLYAIIRMLLQLLLIGYFLVYIFKSNSAWVVVIIFAVMVASSSWIALRTVKHKRAVLYKKAILSIAFGGGIVLIIVTQFVLDLSPWFKPQYAIPLAGMIFASAMNSVSLAAERFSVEIQRDVPYEKARAVAFSASLIPIMNALFAVGLVSIPGMMTGQILSGVEPFIAARYQIMVMLMIFGAAGLSSACFLLLSKPIFIKN